MTEQPAPPPSPPDDDLALACERCGLPMTASLVDRWLCEDCYWDFQTDADGSLGDG